MDFEMRHIWAQMSAFPITNWSILSKLLKILTFIFLGKNWSDTTNIYWSCDF